MKNTSLDETKNTKKRKRKEKERHSIEPRRDPSSRRGENEGGGSVEKILCAKKKKKEEGIKIKNRYICSDADSFHGRNSSDRDIRVESEISRLPRAFNERSKTIRC